MTFGMIQDTRRLATFGRLIAVGTVAALAFTGCASKEKVASAPAVGMGGGMSPPPLTAAYDPSRQVAAGTSGIPWASGPSAMPSASAGGPDFTR